MCFISLGRDVFLEDPGELNKAINFHNQVE